MQHHLRTEIDIAAPPEVVWDVLVDLARYDEWNPFIVHASGNPVVGQRLTNRTQTPGGRVMTFRPVVTEAERARTFEWLGRLGLPGLFDGRHRFELTPSPSGGTTVMHSEQFSGALVPLMRRSLDTGTAAGFAAMNRALKQRVEAPAG